jgi:hypothetical protein
LQAAAVAAAMMLVLAQEGELLDSPLEGGEVRNQLAVQEDHPQRPQDFCKVLVEVQPPVAAAVADIMAAAWQVRGQVVAADQVFLRVLGQRQQEAVLLPVIAVTLIGLVLDRVRRLAERVRVLVLYS